MSTIEAIKAASRGLAAEELTHPRLHIETLEWQLWDEQIERDDKAGKLDRLFAEAEAGIKAGRVRALLPGTG
jgi:hypothetical protein